MDKYLNLLSFIVLFNLVISIKAIDNKVEDDSIVASCYYIKTTGKYKVEVGILDKMAAAYATYTRSYETKGWDFLTLSSYDGVDDKYSDEVKIMQWDIWKEFLLIKEYILLFIILIIINIIPMKELCLIQHLNFSNKIWNICKI